MRRKKQAHTILETTSQCVKSEAMSKLKFHANMADFQRKNVHFLNILEPGIINRFRNFKKKQNTQMLALLLQKFSNKAIVLRQLFKKEMCRIELAHPVY